MKDDEVMVRIWGCRGSHPVCGINYLKYGGNTSCVEINYFKKSKKQRIILDGGTGLGFLGLSLKNQTADEYNIFLSHLHMDHIFSLPHFYPNYQSGNRINIYIHKDYWDAFENVRGIKITKELVMGYPTYQIHPNDFLADIVLHKFDSIYLNGAVIDGHLVDHFEGAIAHRIQVNGKMIIFAPDMANEFLVQKFPPYYSTKADLLICDSLYTHEEINEKTQKKHSCLSSVAGFALHNKIKKVIPFHHSPLRNDVELEKLESECRLFGGDKIGIEFAKDGLEIIV